jgi:acyl carrier protein
MFKRFGLGLLMPINYWSQQGAFFLSCGWRTFWRRLQTPGGYMTDMDQVLTALRTKVSKRFALDIHLLDERARLGDMGVDSLHMMDLMLDMEGELGFNLENLELPPNPTMEEVAAAIVHGLGSQVQAGG